jgi:long-chain acyl-CoA synthetase
MATAFGSGVSPLCVELEAEGSTFKFCGVHSKNREEWMVLDIACSLFGMCSVPFYDTLGPDTIQYILNQTQLTCMLVSADILVAIVALAEKGGTGRLAHVIQMEPAVNPDI